MSVYAKLLEQIIEENNNHHKTGKIIKNIKGIQEYLNHRYPHKKMAHSDKVKLFREGKDAPRCEVCRGLVRAPHNKCCSLHCTHIAVFARLDAAAGHKVPRDPWADRGGY